MTQASGAQRAAVVPVLLYHSISDRAPAGEAPWTVSPSAFRAHLDAIGASGRTALTVTDLGMCLRGVRPLPERAVAVTFDDGYADVLDAVQELAGRGLPSTAYVTTGRVGASGMLSRRAVGDLGRHPLVEVGAHGIRHPHLDALADTALAEEVQGSRNQLEEMLEAPVTSFAYPHGAYDRRARDAVVAAGYQAAVAVKNALSHAADDPFAIARWTVTAHASAEQIRALLDGRGAPLAWSRERVRTRAARTVRRLRRLAAGQSRDGPR